MGMFANNDYHFRRGIDIVVSCIVFNSIAALLGLSSFYLVNVSGGLYIIWKIVVFCIGIVCGLLSLVSILNTAALLYGGVCLAKQYFSEALGLGLQHYVNVIRMCHSDGTITEREPARLSLVNTLLYLIVILASLMGVLSCVFLAGKLLGFFM